MTTVLRDPSFDPVIEVDAAAIAHNVHEVARLAGRPILAVVKNNGYGLGLTTVGPIIDSLDDVVGLAVVKPNQAIELRESGVRKPILLMGMFSENDGEELVQRGIRLAPYADDVHMVLDRIAAKLNTTVPVHLYLDTGMNRVGVPFRRALPWIERVASLQSVDVEGTFMCFAEEDEFDPVQLRRLLDIGEAARERGLELGPLHAQIDVQIQYLGCTNRQRGRPTNRRQIHDAVRNAPEVLVRVRAR